MAVNKKTSDEEAAGALTGDELVRIVQDTANKQTTTQAIANLALTDGVSGTFTTADDKTVTVVNGIITAIEAI